MNERGRPIDVPGNQRGGGDDDAEDDDEYGDSREPKVRFTDIDPDGKCDAVRFANPKYMRDFVRSLDRFPPPESLLTHMNVAAWPRLQRLKPRQPASRDTTRRHRNHSRVHGAARLPHSDHNIAAPHEPPIREHEKARPPTRRDVNSRGRQPPPPRREESFQMERNRERREPWGPDLRPQTPWDYHHPSQRPHSPHPSPPPPFHPPPAPFLPAHSFVSHMPASVSYLRSPVSARSAIPPPLPPSLQSQPPPPPLLQPPPSPLLQPPPPPSLRPPMRPPGPWFPPLPPPPSFRHPYLNLTPSTVIPPGIAAGPIHRRPFSAPVGMGSSIGPIWRGPVPFATPVTYTVRPAAIEGPRTSAPVPSYAPPPPLYTMFKPGPFPNVWAGPPVNHRQPFVGGGFIPPHMPPRALLNTSPTIPTMTMPTMTMPPTNTPHPMRLSAPPAIFSQIGHSSAKWTSPVIPHSSSPLYSPHRGWVFAPLRIAPHLPQTYRQPLVTPLLAHVRPCLLPTSTISTPQATLNSTVSVPAAPVSVPPTTTAGGAAVVTPAFTGIVDTDPFRGSLYDSQDATDMPDVSSPPLLPNSNPDTTRIPAPAAGRSAEQKKWRRWSQLVGTGLTAGPHRLDGTGTVDDILTRLETRQQEDRERLDILFDVDMDADDRRLLLGRLRVQHRLQQQYLYRAFRTALETRSDLTGEQRTLIEHQLSVWYRKHHLDPSYDPKPTQAQPETPVETNEPLAAPAAAASREERFRAIMLLGAVGDAMGFRRGGNWKFTFDGEQIHEEMMSLTDGMGTSALHLTEDEFPVSDDTILHIATATALHRTVLLLPTNRPPDRPPESAVTTTHGLVDDIWIEMLGRQYVECFESGKLLNRMPGLRSWKSIRLLLREGAHHWRHVRFQSDGGGCGAATRSMMIGAALARPEHLPLLVELAANAARLTHNHPLGWMGAVASAAFTSFALQDLPPVAWGRRFMTTVMPLVSQYSNGTGHRADVTDSEQKEIECAFLDFQEMWRRYLKLRQIEAGTGVPAFPATWHRDIRGRDQFYAAISARNRWAGWSGADAPLIAYDALLSMDVDDEGEDHHSAWERLCRNGMLHGGDSDATGALCGAWYGARFGLRGVPTPNVVSIEFKELLSELGTNMYRAFELQAVDFGCSRLSPTSSLSAGDPETLPATLTPAVPGEQTPPVTENLSGGAAMVKAVSVSLSLSPPSQMKDVVTAPATEIQPDADNMSQTSSPIFPDAVDQTAAPVVQPRTTTPRPLAPTTTVESEPQWHHSRPTASTSVATTLRDAPASRRVTRYWNFYRQCWIPISSS